MKIVATADLHFHPRWAKALTRLARDIHDERPDCLIVAGDVGHPLHHFRQGLALFADIPCPRLALAGNHDLWSSGDHTSETLWNGVLAEAAHQAGFAWLDGEVRRLGSLGLCGTLGWYDYSARDPRLELADQDYYINKGMFNNDGNFVDWAWADQEFAAAVLAGFQERLAGLCQDPAIGQIVVATHVPPFEQNMVRKEDDFAWTFGNAFFGNLTLGQAILSCPKVSHVISGHSHHGGRWQIPRPRALWSLSSSARTMAGRHTWSWTCPGCGVRTLGMGAGCPWTHHRAGSDGGLSLAYRACPGRGGAPGTGA